MDHVFWVCLLSYNRMYVFISIHLKILVKVHLSKLTDTIVDSVTHNPEENISFNIECIFFWITFDSASLTTAS